MSNSYPPDDDGPPGSVTGVSSEVLTPRGGFMARPGLKPPPRHAVVVRGGDAPESPYIPVARSSFPPPPPSDSPGARELPTFRAIPIPAFPELGVETPPPPSVEAPQPSSAEAPHTSSGEAPPSSHGPLSDAPLVASVSDERVPLSQRAPRSRWTIAFAAAAGLLLGLASVGVKLRASGVAAQPLGEVTTVTPAAPVPQPTLALAPPQPSASSSAVAPAAERAEAEQKAVRLPAPSAKRSIF